MSRDPGRSKRSRSMSAAASTILMVTHTAFAAGVRAPAPAQGAQDQLFRLADAEGNHVALIDFDRDELITTKVMGALLRSEQTVGRQVGVTTRDGVVTLSGRVLDRAEADRARALARAVVGVVDVRDEFVIVR